MLKELLWRSPSFRSNYWNASSATSRYSRRWGSLPAPSEFTGNATWKQQAALALVAIAFYQNQCYSLANYDIRYALRDSPMPTFIQEQEYMNSTQAAAFLGIASATFKKPMLPKFRLTNTHTMEE